MEGLREASAYASLQDGDYEPMKRLAKAGKISCAEHLDELRQAVRRQSNAQKHLGRKLRRRQNGLFSAGATFAPHEPENTIPSFALFLETILAKSKSGMSVSEAVDLVAHRHGIAPHAVRDAFERYIIR